MSIWRRWGLRAWHSGAAAGAAAAGLGLALMFLLRMMAGLPTLPEAVADGVLQLLPGQLFGLLIDLMQEVGRPLFILGLSVAVVVIGAIEGELMARWTWVREAPVPGAAFRRRGTWPVRVLLPALVLWILTVPLVAIGGTAVLPTAALVVLGDWLLITWLAEVALGVPRQQAVRPARTLGMTPLSHLARRTFLQTAGALAGALTLGSLAIRVIRAVPPPAAARTRAVAIPGGGSAVTGSPRPGDDLAIFGDLSGITPAGDFYIVSKNLLGDPELDAQKWSLRVGGQRPFSLTYAELQAEPHVEQIQTLDCISNKVGGALISNGVWQGVPLPQLLDRAGVPPGTVEISFTCAEGYTESLPLAAAMAPTTLVADHLNGQPLPPRHGFPARILVVGRYGMKNPKWLTAIAPLHYPFRGYWEQRGWSKDAFVHTNSRIDYPAADTPLSAGEVVPVRGVAFAGDRGVSGVEISFDGGGTWSPTRLQPALSPYAWVLWTYAWTPAPAAYGLVVRAADGTGALQSATSVDSFPNGVDGYHRFTVQVSAERAP